MVGHRLNSAHNHVWFGPHSILKIGDFPLKKKKKNLDFHLPKTQKIWWLFSLPTGNHRLALSRRGGPGRASFPQLVTLPIGPPPSLFTPCMLCFLSLMKNCSINAASSPFSLESVNVRPSNPYPPTHTDTHRHTHTKYFSLQKKKKI